MATPIGSGGSIKTLRFLLGILPLLICASAAQAFTLLLSNPGRPQVQGFRSGPIKVYLNNSICPIDLEPIVKDALAVWNVVPASRLWLEYAGLTTATSSTGHLLIQCSANVGDNDSTVGIGGANYPDGPIENGWIYMNASTGQANIANFSRNIVVTAMAHELGHALGFGHSADSTAIMYYAVGPRDPILLTQDDIDGVNFLYNRDELGGDKLMGCATLRAPPPGRGSGPALWTMFFLLLPLVAFARLRPRLQFAK